VHSGILSGATEFAVLMEFLRFCRILRNLVLASNQKWQIQVTRLHWRRQTTSAWSTESRDL